jgi:hypothetical protein
MLVTRPERVMRNQVQVEVDETMPLAIGVAYRQDAIYAVDADALWVVRCADATVRSYVGSFRDRLDGTVPLPTLGSEELRDLDGPAEGVAS